MARFQNSAPPRPGEIRVGVLHFRPRLERAAQPATPPPSAKHRRDLRGPLIQLRVPYPEMT